MAERLTGLVIEYSLWIVFFGLWLDSIFAAAPGETLLIMAAFFARRHGAEAWGVLMCGIAGAWLGSYTSYIIGRRLGRANPHFLGKLGITPARINKITWLVQRYGLWVLVLARFIPGSRQVVYYIAGLGNMQPAKFHTASLAGIIPWAGLAVYVGLFFGDNWNFAQHRLRSYWFMIGITGVLIFTLYLLWARYFRKTPDSAR